MALGPCAFRIAAAQAQTMAVRPTALSETLHVLTVESVNVVAKTGPEGAVLVDGGPAAARVALLDALAALPSSGPVRTLFNTHWHPEQTGLNEHVGTAGGAIIAQDNTRLWLSTDITYPWDGSRFEALPEVAQPNKTFYDEGELDSGIRYGYLRHAAHTDGDLYVQFPAENVLAVGDTVSSVGWPFVDWWTGGWIGGIVGNLELLLSLTGAETRIVPARGPMLRRTDLEAQYGMYNVIYERLARMLNAGRGPDEAVAARPTAEFEAAMGASDEFVRRAFESLWAYLSPDA
jgi:glyoxylase-like metal-dependent hydrolase (beta-lactamase superfamily II)